MGSILLVIPFYKGDKGQVERLGKWMRALSKGNRIGEKLLFCATESTDPAGIGTDFVGLFDEIKAIRQTFGPSLVPNEPAWPKACNFQFCHVARYIYEHRKDVDAWYYFEPDCLPLCPDWFDKICADYEKQGKAFYGVKASYVQRSGDTRWEDGDHLIGTAIYPQNAWMRIKSYEEIERKQPNRPWDAITRDEVNPQAHFTNLIANVHGARGYRDDQGNLSALYRTNLDAAYKRRPVKLDPETVVMHGCKDSSFRLLMGKRLGILQETPLTFAHAGDLGDIIWALPAIKEKGGGILKFSPHGYAREAMTEVRIRMIAPLLLEQAYIKGIEKHDEGFVDFDFRHFRVLHKQHSNLVLDQAEWIGSTATGEEAWLKVPPTKPNQQVIINRTERYHNEDFPWANVHRAYGQALRFIGLDSEHSHFQKEFGTIDFIPTEDLLEVAKLIQSSQLFIGNQSVCNAINEGLKHNGIQETCPEAKDCLFKIENIVYFVDGQLELPDKKEETTSFNINEFFKLPAFRKEIEQIVHEMLIKELG